jgi:malonyl-ACP decarboxylase
MPDRLPDAAAPPLPAVPFPGTAVPEAGLVVSGLGVVTALGQGKAALLDGLLQPRNVFGVLQREGRQLPASAGAAGRPFLGAEIGALQLPEALAACVPRGVSWSSRVAIAALHEAWDEARLHDVAPERIGLVIGGSNFQQRELALTHEAYRERAFYLRPGYAHAFMDSDAGGLLTELFAIRGLACTLGGASASGQVAVLQAMQAVASGQVDACIAVGALMDLSHWELQAFRSIGAMGSERHAAEPALACRPFDTGRDGFLYGESCAAVVVERADGIRRPGVAPYARCAGGAVAMDAHRNPDPSLDGEVRVIHGALARAGIAAADIDYVNTHGTASPLGDQVELQALRAGGLQGAWLNATKSIIGHGLSAAGAVEIAATLLQMRAGRLHANRNLETPIDPGLNWVPAGGVAARVQHALTLSFGFGGINSALCLQQLD